MFSLLYTFCLHFYLINIHVFDYLDSWLSGLFTKDLMSPDNRGSTVLVHDSANPMEIKGIGNSSYAEVQKLNWV